MIKNRLDRLRKVIKCLKCQRILAKIDEDGTIHAKPSKGPQIIITGDNVRAMFICERISYFVKRDGLGQDLKESIPCGNKTLLENGAIHV